MTAVTGGIGLPYQVGSDRPCDAPGVWCDLAEMLDARLLTVSNELGRVSPTVPMAKVTRSTVTAQPVPAAETVTVRFDGVEVDTDQMVDFSRSQFNILPRRNGLYYVSGLLATNSSDVDAINLVVTKGPVTVIGGSVSFSQVAAANQSRATTGTWWMHASSHVGWSTDDGDTVGFGLLISPHDPGTFNLVAAALTVHWITDAGGTFG